MKQNKYRLVLLVALLLSFTIVLAVAKRKYFKHSGVPRLAITIYNGNFAFVKERTEINLNKGVNHYRFANIPRDIEPASVTFKSLTDPSRTAILEQNYEYDLINRDKLLSRYLDKEITASVKTADGKEKQVKAKLVSVQNVLIAKTSDGQILLNPEIRTLPELPDGIISKPTLEWQVASKRTGTHSIELSYITGNVNWKANYNAVVDESDKSFDLTGWVTIDNKSGMTYKNPKIKLMAGDVSKYSDYGYAGKAGYAQMEYLRSVNRRSFNEKPFSEFHLYTLQRTTTLKDNQTKQIQFVIAQGVPSKKLLIYDAMKNFNSYYGDYNSSSRASRYYGTGNINDKVWVMMEFKNDKASGLGIPLPEGLFSVYKKDEDSLLEFIGQDKITHTPQDETIRIYLGNAFDIVGQRTQTSFKYESDKNFVEEEFKITLKNHKKNNETVRVVEHLYRWSNWKILSSSDSYTKKDVRTLEFEVNVPADGQKGITYKVYYWW